MNQYRKLTLDERSELERRGCHAESWDNVDVAPDFCVEQLCNVRLEGEIRIGSGSYISFSTLRNYTIGRNCHIDSVLRMECRHSSLFGNGVMVAAVNENGGRSIPIYNELTSQMAYLMAMMRNKVAMTEELQRKVMAEAEKMRSEIGRVGNNVTILGVRFIREVNIADNVNIEGASHLENSTILEGCSIGVDVRAKDFIADCHSVIESGACIERCFVGERSHLANGFTAADSLFFANCHFENGEAAAIYAGPFTVSHHKSSLLIAGIFSFFNAGSGTNQSNHLFKSGAVHQAVHLRGSKFGSNAYVMSPAIEGPYTVILGRHTRHHDTQDMPYSYLIEEGGHSTLVPAIALTSYGTVRDIEKWKQRDRRTAKHDNIHFEEHNPYLTGKMLRGVDILTRLHEDDTEAKEYNYNRTTIKATMLQRGIKLYNSAIAASIGSILSRGDLSRASAFGCGEWVDIGGQYLPFEYLERIIECAESKESTIGDVRGMFDKAMANYDDMAAAYACNLLGGLLGHTPTSDDIEGAIAASKRIIERMREKTEADRLRDTGVEMMIGYGYDFRSVDEQLADFKNTR
ncbi:MAG: DUF4954 family protein [Alistipes sp.]|nr:DUF4954 family protein [Alistipes sp.]